MDWFKKHVDTIAILGTFALCFWTLNEKMNDRNEAMNARLGVIEKDIAIIKTVLIMKDILPKEIAKTHEVKE